MKVTAGLIIAALNLVTGLNVCAQNVRVNELVGSLAHGQSALVTGSGFGQKNPAAPVLYDTVGNQAAYAGVADGTLVPVGPGYPWVLNGTNASAHDHVYLSRNRPNRGRTSAHYFAPVKGFLTGPDLGGAEVPRFYATWWVKTSHDIICGPGGCASTKLIRVWEDGAGEHARFSWTGGQITAGCGWGFPDSVNIWANWRGVLNQWNRLEVFLDGPAGLIRLDTNSENVVNTNSYVSNGHYLNRIWRIGIDPSSPENLDQNLVFEFGEIYVDITPARVEICEGASWLARGRCEIQPVTAWSDSQISFVVNHGAFSAGSSAYLFVLDGSSQTGDPIAVSLADSTDTLAPAAPGALREHGQG